jgi:hypothetical protein
MGFVRSVSLSAVQVVPVAQKSTANCPGWSRVKETVLPLTVGIRIIRIRAEVKRMLLVTVT